MAEPDFEQVFFTDQLGIGDTLIIDSLNPGCWVDIEVTRRDQTGPLVHVREASDRYSFELGQGYLIGSSIEVDGDQHFEPNRIVQGGLLVVLSPKHKTTSEIAIPSGNMRIQTPPLLPLLH